MKKQSVSRTIVAGVVALGANLYVMGCGFDPMNYLSRNACEFFNCDELFFIEDILPLSAQPTGNAGSGAGVVMDMGETEDDDGGGHAH